MEIVTLNPDDTDSLIDSLEGQIEELKQDLENMTEEKDIQYDRAEKLQEKLEPFEDLDEETLEKLSEYSIEGLLENQERLENGELVDASEAGARALEIAQELKSCYIRLNLGVLSEIEEIIKLTDELIELHS